VTDGTKSLVSSRFGEVGIEVSSQGSLDSSVIEKDKLIDNHYYAIANKASLSKPADLNPPASKQQEPERNLNPNPNLTPTLTLNLRPRPRPRPRPHPYPNPVPNPNPNPNHHPHLLPPPRSSELQEFEAKFDISWKKAVTDGVVFNAVDGCKRLGIDGATMDKQWVRRPLPSSFSLPRALILSVTHLQSTPLPLPLPSSRSTPPRHPLPPGAPGGDFRICAPTRSAYPSSRSPPTSTPPSSAQAEAKKAGNLVKFGGGFYAGKLPAKPKEDTSKGWLAAVVLSLFTLLGK
ncbi:MAG: hypothetical protein SGPRY_012385, partial [Prymnesium sp.]